MQKMQGKHFEKDFVYGQLAGHVMDVLKFRDASQELKDNELKQFAAQTLPKLQQHLQTAQRLAGWNEAMPASTTEHGTGTTRPRARPPAIAPAPRATAPTPRAPAPRVPRAAPARAGPTAPAPAANSDRFTAETRKGAERE